MTEAQELPPLDMRRDAFSPIAGLREILHRFDATVSAFTNAFGMQSSLLARVLDKPWTLHFGSSSMHCSH